MMQCNTCNEYKDIEKDFISYIRSRDNKPYTSKVCKSCTNKKAKEKRLTEDFIENKRPQMLERIKEYKQQNKYYFKAYYESYKPRRNALIKQRKEENPTLKVIDSLRARVKQFVKSKTLQSSELLDCDRQHLNKWLEYNFVEGIDFSNYGKVWHIDHIIPCSFFDLSNEENQKICFNWSNLRPCFKEENLSKSNKIEEDIVLFYQKQRLQFLQTHQEYQGGIEIFDWLKSYSEVKNS